MAEKIIWRIFASIVLLISVLFWPFWLSIILALCAMLYFKTFWEAVILFLFSDFLFGTSAVRFYGFTYISFLLSFVILIIVELLKKWLKFYPADLKI